MDPAERCFEGHTQTKTREEKTQFYDSWSKQYEEDMHTVEYRGPAIVADVLAELYPGTRENVCILDVAAGTGLVGVELAKQGFVKVDALDPSQGMLDEAKTKGVYQKMICSYFDEKELNIEPDTYDVIVICGACSNRHLPCDCLWEAVRLVKPGGYFVMATRPTQLNTIQEYKGHLEPLMDEIEKEGKWEKVR
ncbi:Williams-Beuren syndrome chromosomal region 27 protein-like isoform X1 [Mizuhopecten yessoensis]|uniref:Williams-Beuren syndrome chromosomal region 27 protein n=1 Tax=Mizuhopecten yessoensis TaxID=6573 RepID=A0A210QUV7_MIZYE|nr:Williams-Beuren syndrome chromosomal region 27 protein-like isoform X1 [Mizuhopecten yessoensis]OWF52505.1 Williams-Beuren syndrome chromosomal region 27 protein [Mizuhopecten yessoensis]